MKFQMLAIGTKMPAWVQAGCAEYQKRLPKDFSVEIKELALAPRGKSTSIETAMEREAEQILGAIAPQSFVIALDSRGKQWTTERLATQVQQWREQARPVALLVGGPDGLAPSCLQRADLSWSLSALTLPHPLVRVVVLEQLYRVWSFLNNHPYHK